METEIGVQIRPAIQADARQIAGLIHSGMHVHRHLDWRSPMDWIGFPPYLVAEQSGRLCAAMACSPDPPKIAWLRLFVHTDWLPVTDAWWSLWDVAHADLSAEGDYLVVAIALHGWLEDVLHTSRFSTHQQIQMLEWNGAPYEDGGLPTDVLVRPMTLSDLPAVADVDAAAFEPLWQNSLTTLTRGFQQVGVATVAEIAGQLIGYQLSTRNPYGIHLARLAVRSEAQRHGVGFALAVDLLHQAEKYNVNRVTVNTQSDNLASLKLYQRLGFRLTGESYPVYQYRIK
jgi:ribosomal protein S18 acetylase RimI-like enzyme